MTASEASRRFSAVLDGAEGGETVVVTRGGRPVALIVPAPRSNGDALSEVVRNWQQDATPDDEFAAAVAAARDDARADLDGDPWRA